MKIYQLKDKFNNSIFLKNILMSKINIIFSSIFFIFQLVSLFVFVVSYISGGTKLLYFDYVNLHSTILIVSNSFFAMIIGGIWSHKLFISKVNIEKSKIDFGNFKNKFLVLLFLSTIYSFLIFFMFSIFMLPLKLYLLMNSPLLFFLFLFVGTSILIITFAMFYILFHLMFTRKFFIPIYLVIFSFLSIFFGFGANTLPSGGEVSQFITVNNAQRQIKFQHYKINDAIYFIPYFVTEKTSSSEGSLTTRRNVNLFLVDTSEFKDLENRINNWDDKVKIYSNYSFFTSYYIASFTQNTNYSNYIDTVGALSSNSILNISFYGTNQKIVKYSSNDMFPNLLEKIKTNDSDLINYSIDEITSNNTNNKNFMYIEIGKDTNPYWIFMILLVAMTAIILLINWFLIDKKYLIYKRIIKEKK
ncbi:hypothetical protein [Malacoplasma iowae]|uniref:hypothetical protein n=1 Tax=Malacoplasma iowae TaxID=2116 RepID=UPI002A18B8E0|nr:hypothetical protein [Malacoplasma iowae]WPL40218.1 hypothetical protein QX183_01540 [Malacoplasma iowae]